MANAPRHELIDGSHCMWQTNTNPFRLAAERLNIWGEEFRCGIALTTLHTIENVLRWHSWHSIRIPKSRYRVLLWHNISTQMRVKALVCLCSAAEACFA